MKTLRTQFAENSRKYGEEFREMNIEIINESEKTLFKGKAKNSITLGDTLDRELLLISQTKKGNPIYQIR